ncbi:putative secreted protein (Por secretion system target) [Neolewinella xylanilytica]|uniref:Putative secreted protein (Por secretion system target) n=1 Tax=Neolewinella xylanilytica TaxID=1514080 RepID=A0A2S6I493_9BACT|nr:prolyl oligopeptidase family serine peptidase [Neolewinella xylanilytica]PPK85990.1 putative secreted protein (Por secretion system target) [Neolewinella xylanilytica]
MRHLLLASLLSLACSCAHAQTLISTERQNGIPGAILGLFLPITPQYDVINYKVLYKTTDALGRPDTASGLLSLPAETSLAFPMTAYMHGTAVDETMVPSNPQTQERFLVYALATSGYITVAPDYIGLGESDGFHPYVHAESESNSGRDLLLAARQFLDEEEIPYNDQLFVTGYSQGGHAAQALQRDLQEDEGNDSLNVTAGAHLSGPYSISEVMRLATLSNDRPTLPGYIVYTYVSYSNVYGIYDSLGQAFVSPYLEVIDSFDQQLIDGEHFNAQLDTLLVEREERLIDMFQDSVVQQIIDNDSESAIIQALRANDTYEWAPEVPTLLFYCTEDEQVPAQNAILADSVMRERGSTTVVLESGGALDHGGCVEPAVTRALAFFETYAERNPVSTRGVYLDLPALRLSPNPLSPGEQLLLTGLPRERYRYTLLDLQGRSVQTGEINEEQSLTIGHRLSSSMYLLRLESSEGNYTARKVVVR